MPELSEFRPRYPPPGAQVPAVDVARRSFPDILLGWGGIGPETIPKNAPMFKGSTSQEQPASSVHLLPRGVKLTNLAVFGIAVGGAIVLTLGLILLIYAFLKRRDKKKRHSGPYTPAFAVEDQGPTTSGRRRLRKKNTKGNNVGSRGSDPKMVSDGSPSPIRRSSVPQLPLPWSSRTSFNPFATKAREAKAARERAGCVGMGMRGGRESAVWLDSDALHGPTVARKTSARRHGGGDGEKRGSWPANEMRRPTLPVAEGIIEGPETAMAAAYGVQVPPTRGERGVGMSPDTVASGPRVYVSPDRTISVAREPFRNKVKMSGDRGLSLSQILNRTEVRLAIAAEGCDEPEMVETMTWERDEEEGEKQHHASAQSHTRESSVDSMSSEDSMSGANKHHLAPQESGAGGLTSPSRTAGVGLGVRELPDPNAVITQLGRNGSMSSRSSGLSTVYSVGDDFEEEADGQPPVDPSAVASMLNTGVIGKPQQQLPDPFTSASPPKNSPCWPKRKVTISGQMEPDSPSKIRDTSIGNLDTTTTARISILGSSRLSQTPSLVFPTPSTDPTAGPPHVFVTSPSEAASSWLRSPLANSATKTPPHGRKGPRPESVEVDLDAVARELEEEMEQERYWQLERQQALASTPKSHQSSPSGPPPTSPPPSLPRLGLRIVEGTPPHPSLSVGDVSRDSINMVPWELDGTMLSLADLDDTMEGNWMSHSTPPRGLQKHHADAHCTGMAMTTDKPVEISRRQRNAPVALMQTDQQQEQLGEMQQQQDLTDLYLPTLDPVPVADISLDEVGSLPTISTPRKRYSQRGNGNLRPTNSNSDKTQTSNGGLALAVADLRRMNSMVSNYSAVSSNANTDIAAAGGPPMMESPTVSQMRGGGFGPDKNKGGNKNYLALGSAAKRRRGLSMGEVLKETTVLGEKENQMEGGDGTQDPEGGAKRSTSDGHGGQKIIARALWQRMSNESLYDDDGFLKSSPHRVYGTKA